MGDFSGRVSLPARRPHSYIGGQDICEGAMQVDVLGPVRVRSACAASEPLMAKERALLSLLALNVARTVPRIDCEIALWGDDPPRTAAESLRSHVSRLRRCLGSDSVATSADGYRLAVPPDAVDAARLHSALVCDSQATVDVDPVTRRRRLADAENLWRGEPLLDLADTARRREQVEWLREQWEQVREARIEADLDLGRHAQVVEELQRALVDQPMRETRWRLLMLALYRSGRQVEALRAYERLRMRLATEWGWSRPHRCSASSGRFCVRIRTSTPSHPSHRWSSQLR